MEKTSFTPEELERAKKIVFDKMLANDAFSQLLDLHIEVIQPGMCQVSAIVSDRFTNGFNIAHGGLVFSLADSAVAFAANAYGNLAVTMENSISYIHPAYSGDKITITAKKIEATDRTAWYEAAVFNNKNQRLALFKSTLRINNKTWEI